MSASPFTRIPAATAAAVCGHYQPGPAARNLLHDDLTPRAFLHLLAQLGEHQDAIRFLAHALPKREGIWWGCLCLWHACRPTPEPAITEVVQAAVEWVLEPTEENRRLSVIAVESLPISTPAGCLGRAVVWTDGSLLAPGLPVLLPPPHLTAHSLSGAVQMAAGVQGSHAIDASQRLFIQLGLEVATGENLWEQPSRDPHPARPSTQKPIPVRSARPQEDHLATPAVEVSS